MRPVVQGAGTAAGWGGEGARRGRFPHPGVHLGIDCAEVAGYLRVSAQSISRCARLCGNRGSRVSPAGAASSRALASLRRMRAEATTASPADTGADTIAIGLFEGEGVAHDVDGGALQALVDAGEVRPKLRKVAVAHAGGHRYVLVGLGERDAFDPERARVAAAVAAGRARELGTKVLAWELPHHVEDAHAAALVEGTVLADYEYRAYKTGDDDGTRLDELIVSAHHDVAGPVGVAHCIAEAAN